MFSANLHAPLSGEVPHRVVQTPERIRGGVHLLHVLVVVLLITLAVPVLEGGNLGAEHLSGDPPTGPAATSLSSCQSSLAVRSLALHEFAQHPRVFVDLAPGLIKSASVGEQQ